ncbi:MAG: pyridoxal phosphate-dependent aminotransferase [Elusimicrobiota bacterium]|nr:pyridoxal phosphate-dependent aminotransferase [Elusimicrobiota bacterium]
MRLSSRAEAASESATLRLSAVAARLRAGGREVLSLLEGEPDLPAPSKVLEATRRALSRGLTRYSDAAGLPELRALISRKLATRNGIAAAPEDILVTNGAKQALYDALQTICGPGDEVLIPSPYWVSFPESVRLAGAKPVFVATRAHQLDVDAVARAVTPRTRAIIINSPNNPTGAVYPAAALRALARLAARRDLLIVSDEAYEDFAYDGAAHLSVAALGAARRTITIQTFSKSYSMTGFRVGFLAAPPEIARAARRLHGHITGNVCTFAQHGAIAALGLGRGELERRRAVYQKRRDLAYALASRGFDCVKPRGGLFVFADARRHLGGHIKDAEGLAEHLLHKAGVSVVPGSACGMEGFLRFSFTSPEPVLREAFARIEAAL